MVLASVVAGTSALTGVLAAVDTVPRWVLIALAGVTAVGTAVGGQITQARTVPWVDVAAKRVEVDGDTHVVAGPATTVRTGAPVDVTPAVPGNYVP
jgi:hypothetical protein